MPDEMIAERKEQLKSEDPKVRHTYEHHVKRFVKELESRGLAPNTIKTYYHAIQSFFKRNYLPLELMRGDSPKAESVLEGCRAATKEDIRRMVEVSDPRVRALILFAKDTGLSEADIVKLKIKDLGVEKVEDVFKLEPPVPLILRREKSRAPIITFVGQEALSALRTTLDIRMRGSPEIVVRRKYTRNNREVTLGYAPESLTLESPLFRSYGKWIKTDKAKPLTKNALTVIFRKAAIQAGIWKPGFSGHSLRRFFKTSLESAGVPSTWIEIMLGHVYRRLELAYSRPTVEMLRDAYMKAYEALAISEAAITKSQVEWLQQQVEFLNKENITLKEAVEDREHQIKMLEARLKEYEEKLRRLEPIEEKMERFEALLTEDVLKTLKKLAKKRK
jgi:integrase